MVKSTSPVTPTAQIDSLVEGWHHQPHSILGGHLEGSEVVIRVLRPWAKSIAVVINDVHHAMTHEHRGVWIVRLSLAQVPDYTLSVDYGQGSLPADDPYRFLPTVSDFDLDIFSAGRHEDLWTILGAHRRTYGYVHGTAFTVWAPNAQGVRVAGDFNSWESVTHPMRSMGQSGVWELFIPYVEAGAHYRFEILGRDGNWHTKSDPMAFHTDVPPANASVVFESAYTWSDEAWMHRRASNNPHNGPMSTYEVHIGSWRPGLGYRELAKELVDYVVESGFTHVEFMPVAEHPYAPSWGYQVTSYYAPSSRFGNPDDFRFLVDALHQAGIGVIVDWVPAHFPKDAWALARFDGTPLYEHADPRRGEHPDWGTYIFDFGRNEVRNFLVANALYWLQEFHVDGLRVDAVSSMIYLDYSREVGQWEPNRLGGRENLEAVAFMQETNATVYRKVPGVVMIAEESTAWGGVTSPTDVGGLGFGFKWNMGWMHDSLEYMKHDPIHRRYHHGEMTFSLAYAWSENFILPLSHDEVVHGKGSLYERMPGDHWQKLANLRAYLAFMWAHPGKQLLFMGSEFAQPAEWTESKSLDWHLLEYAPHQGVLRCVQQLNKVYRESPQLWERDNEPAGFEWIILHGAADNVFAWARIDHSGRALVSVTNLSPVVRHSYAVGVPQAGHWREVLNTDAQEFGGSGILNSGILSAHAQECYGNPGHLEVTLPPLATCWFVLD
jgi:1,4-alpha-glucan branching enzyme